MHRLAFLLLLGCGDPAPAPALTAEPPAPPVAPVAASTEPPVGAPSVTPAAPVATLGEVYLLSRRRWGDGPRTVLVELPDAPRPAGPVIAYTEAHHSYYAFREIAVEPTPSSPIVVIDTYPSVTMCETGARSARRLHAVHIADESGTVEELGETTFLALELVGCDVGATAVVGVPLAGVTARALARDELPDPVPVELVDLVRDADAAYADPPAAADYRMLALPHLGITVVSGNMPHVVREGRLWNERWGGDPDTLIEAGGAAFFVVSSVAEDWSSSLECFHPTYAEGSCEVTDPSGTPTNVRGGPSGRSPVLTTVSVGATLPADDHVGSWFHVRSTPPGWVHASAVRCTELQRAPAPCP